MGEKIIVVEDDKDIGQVVSEYLREAGLSVLWADNGKTARQYIADDPAIDLFILDIMLPHVSGIELLRLIREHDAHQAKPVIMLTALNDEYTQLMSFDGLADDYVTKPFSPKILVKRVQALLRRMDRSRNKMQPKGIIIDAECYEAYEDGVKLPLTLKEFELLKALAEHSGRVYTRQQLLDLAWGYDFYGDDRLVDVHIKNLRKKIQRNAIVTVKGIGYKFSLDGGQAG